MSYAGWNKRPHLGSQQPRLDRLRTEVLAAVRGAVAEAMADGHDTGELSRLDLDFRLRTGAERPKNRPTLGVFALALGLAVAGLAAGLAITISPAGKSEAPVALPASAHAVLASVSATPDALATAQDLAARGAIQAARGLLEPMAPAQAAAARLLARSYDPNVLAGLPNVDAPADTAQARFWYRRWFTLASTSGAAPEAGELDQLLHGLDDDETSKH